MLAIEAQTAGRGQRCPGTTGTPNEKDLVRVQEASEVRQVENCSENQNKNVSINREVIKHSWFLRIVP